MSFLDTLLQGIRLILNGGSPVTVRPGLNFVSGFTVTDNPANNTTDVTAIAGGTPPGLSITNVSTLRTTSPNAANTASLLGYSSAGDGGGGPLFWDSTSTASDDGGTVFAVSGVATGRWRRTEALLGNYARPEWWGGLSNAIYFNGTNGKYYKDIGLTTEADDDLPKCRKARDYISAQLATRTGIGQVRASGRQYCKSFEGPSNEFLLHKSGVSWYGENGAEFFVPGGTTTGSTGYASILGRSPTDQTSTYIVNNVTVQGFRFDHNSDHNQWAGANFNSLGVLAQTCSVAFSRGDNNWIKDCTVVNHNGTFSLIHGAYGNIPNTTNAKILNCSLEHMSDDPNVGDSSLVVVAGIGFQVSQIRVTTAGSSPSAHWPNGTITTAGEFHGIVGTIDGFMADNFGDGINVCADSWDAGQITISNFTITNVLDGIGLCNFNGKVFRGLKLRNGIITLRAGTVPSPEIGISIAATTAQGSGVTYGLGIFDLAIENVSIDGASTPTAGSYALLLQQSNTGGQSVTPATWQATHAYSFANFPNATVPSTPNGFYYVPLNAGTSGGSPPAFTTVLNTTFTDGTVTWQCAGVTVGGVIPTGGGYELHRIRATNFAGGGCLINGPAGSGGKNLLQDIHHTNNSYRNTGQFGGLFASGTTRAGQTTSEFIGLVNKSNTIVADNGNTGYGSYVSAFTDTTSVLDFGNIVVGATVAKFFLDTTTFPSATQTPPSETFTNVNTVAGSVGIEKANQTTNLQVPGLALSNHTAATSGVPIQNPPGSQWFGNYWDGIDNAVFSAFWQAQIAVSGASPQFNWNLAASYDAAGFVNPFSLTHTPGTNTVAISTDKHLRLDQSGVSGGDLTVLYNATGGKVFFLDSGSTAVVTFSTPSGGTTSAAWGSTCSQGFFGVTPVGQQSRSGQLTDNTGGTISSTLAAIAAGASYTQADMVAVKNALASLAAKHNTLDTALHNLGLST